MESSLYWIGMIGIVAFTISAVLTVIPKGTNLWSASVFGLITAIGGGTIRDVILDVPVFWAVDLNYIWVSLGASLAVFISQSFFTRKYIFSAILYLDGIGVALFAIEATDKVCIWHSAGQCSEETEDGEQQKMDSEEKKKEIKSGEQQP